MKCLVVIRDFFDEILVLIYRKYLKLSNFLFNVFATLNWSYSGRKLSSFLKKVKQYMLILKIVDQISFVMFSYSLPKLFLNIYRLGYKVTKELKWSYECNW